jgi:hypothetical protein
VARRTMDGRTMDGLPKREMIAYSVRRHTIKAATS